MPYFTARSHLLEIGQLRCLFEINTL